MRRFGAGMAAAAALLAWTAAANAATFTTTTTADSAVGDGACTLASCTLRQAITAANAAGGADTVSVIAGDYHLTTGVELVISDSVFLQRGGAGTVTIDADGTSRVLRITAPTSISNVTITGGNVVDTTGIVEAHGGGIEASAALALDTVVVTDNHVSSNGGGAYGGGLWIDAQLSPSDTTFSDNSVDGTASSRAYGGGLYLGAGGSSNLLGLTVSGNSASTEDGAALGGGLFSEATGATNLFATFADNHVTSTGAGGVGTGGGGAFMTSGTSYGISSSRFSANTAQTAAGYASGGGLVAGAPTVTIRDSTFDANRVTSATVQVSGGAMQVGGDVTIANSTLVDNQATGADASGGAALLGFVYALSDVSLQGVTLTRNSAGTGGGIALVRNTTVTPTGSILSANTAGTDADCTLLPGPVTPTFVSGGGNVLGSAAMCGSTTTTDDVVATDPGVGPLADNGGLTPTALLTAASPAVDRYSTGCPALDQRGIGRPQGSACDAGAVEMRAATYTAAPGFLAFGSVTVGSSSPTQGVTITNAGDFPGVPPLAIGSADAGNFTLSGCAAAVAAGDTCTASVGFAPTSTGFKAAGLNGAATTVTLGGTGVAAPPPPPAPTAGGGSVPQCRDLDASTPFQTAFGLQLECSATVWNWAITRAPEHGTLSPIGPRGQVDYTPDTGFSGDDSFRYVAEGGGGQSAPATVVVHVGPGPATSAQSTSTAGRTCKPYRVTVRLNPHGVRFVRARVSVDGAGVQPVHRGARWTASFELKGAPGQQVTVRIRGRRTDGRLLTRTRVLTVC